MKATVMVQNLKCGGCAKTIIDKVSELENVSDVQVDVDTSSVSFNYQELDDALLVKQRLKQLGYPSVDMKNTTSSMLKSYLSCASGKMK
ncbi:heavy-metal-associated domain-containing protein [Maribacter cobaltidurans]|uniref:Heavy metal transporter n=1 Tax=Maribacter cobaltidurans TaxID=1178778 RepID=A0A223V901_9FLAO|nr:heavy-metal-associated domain-containing protein [Maribacter cobaltidurans]ASV31727.1 heavy metal transporter [Maribacter cobaltidurans]GGD93503.1 hypothetical protein GCM10011412_34360 [Maribacter cobaltidurans]